LSNDMQNIHEELAEYINTSGWNRPAFYDDDDDEDVDYTIAITPNDTINSLIMGDEHLETVPAMESDEFIKSSVENLVPNPRSLLNHDSSIIPSSSKIDSLLDEFRLLYDNSSPRPPKEFVSKNSNTDDESFSPSPIMEEIDLTFTPDDPMPSSIEEDDNDSRDTLIREELLDNYSLPIPKNESFHFDIPLFSRPPAKPPD
nr:hypothetical protein [Tanacetum cinerariifolium]